MNSDQARQRAEQSFIQEKSPWAGRRTLPEYEARALAIREKTARLKALRLAKKAQAMTEEQAGRRLTRRDK